MFTSSKVTLFVVIDLQIVLIVISNIFFTFFFLFIYYDIVKEHENKLSESL